MSVKEITGLLTILPDKEKPNQAIREELQAGNIAFRSVTLRRTLHFWNNNSAGSNYAIAALPFKQGGLLDDLDINVGHSGWNRANISVYPSNPTGSVVAMATFDFSKFRATGTIGTVGSALISRVHSALCAVDQISGNIGDEWGGDNLVSVSDLPADYTQIGIVYAHPMFQASTSSFSPGGTLTTAVGTNFVTFTNAEFWDQLYVTPTRFGVLRIATGADAGFYFVQNVDFSNNRLYLRNLNGTNFVGQAAATIAETDLYLGPGRTTYFNEVSIIPFGTGTVVTGGRFNPGTLRSSFILRVKIEKTGSDQTAAAAEQQGSYTIGLRPWTHGEYDNGHGYEFALYRPTTNEGNSFQFRNHTYPYTSSSGGAANGMVLDEVGQRVWAGVTNANNDSCIIHWRWRTIESPREVANYLGTAGHASFLTPTPVLATGDRIRGATIGSNRWVYFAVGHPTLGNGGIIIIKPDLTTLQYTETSGVPDSNVAGAIADKTRARLGTAGDVTTTAATNQLNSASAAFTDSDIGRAIKVTGATNDNGTYKIATRNSATQVTVTTLAGGAVSFTGGTGGTFEIGDRLYLFFNDAVTGAGKINYMESIAPGTFLNRTVTMTNGATCRVQGQTGENQKISIDPANGNIYWLSTDTQEQVNKYEVATNTHSFIAISNANLLSPAGGVVQGGANPATNPATPTVLSVIHVNSKFDEIWVGSDAGHFKIVKSTFSDTTIKRYFGNETTTYFAGAVQTTGTGNGTTGLSFSSPNVTLNATGTPFTANDVGKYIVITGATTAGNNGYFRITTFNSSSSITFVNAAGATQSNYAGTFYVEVSPMQRSDGSFSSGGNSRIVRNYWEHPDGRIQTSMWPGTTVNHDFAYYSREADTFTFRVEVTGNQSISGVGRNKVFDSVGWFWDLCYNGFNAGTRMWLGSVELNYQWIGSAWVPKEIGYSGLPNKSVSDTSNPNCAAKPIHSALEDTLYGVKIGFTKQGGATPANNEFLGRGGQTRTTATDGATVAGAATFDGSSFVAGDAGRTLRIETGGDAGTYKINTFVNAGQVTLKNMDGTTFSALATAGTLTYTIWDFGAVGSNAGPEDMTVMLADGVGKDNTQDITGFTYEGYHFKTRLHENDEGRKFMVENPLAVPGSIATKVYFEQYPRAIPQYDAATSHHKALPGAEHTNGRQVLDGIMGKWLEGTGGRASVQAMAAANQWFGINADSAVAGYSLMVDFGKDVEVGYAVLRLRTTNDSLVQLLSTVSNHGMRANVYKANSAGGTPVVSSVVRTSGTSNFSVTINTTTASVSSGDFLGPVTLTPTTPAVGQITTGLSTFLDTTNAQFLASHVGQVLKITAGAGADIGSYRIIAFNSSSSITVRNLDQTAKVWTVSSATVTYEIRDGVREEDKITSAGHVLCVERLLTVSTLQLRTGPNATITNQSWSAIIPTWDLVKRISFSTEAAPPEVKNNGTWMAHDGREAYDYGDAKVFMDFSDLASANKTGRWWKWTAMPRFAGNSGTDQNHFISVWEFYDTTGKRLATSNYDMVDESRTNVDYFFNHLNRFDVIQGANDAMSGVSGFNGNVDITGAGGDTLTLTTGGNKFLGFQIGPALTDGNLPVGTNQINSASSSWPASAMPGRMIRITSGANAGNFYRVATRPLATQVTVTTPSGGSVSWAGTESSINFSVHEGFNVGGTAPDKFVFLEDGREFTLATINDALTTLTFSETLQPLRTNKTWEIRRPGYDTTSTTTEATKTARLVRPMSTFPVQSGDLCHDSRGTYRFFSEDVGTGFQRADGSIAGGSGVFTGTSFSPDDVGRLLYITTGANLGIYEISVFTSATSITVKNHYTGAAVSLTTDAGPVTYQIYGDRRFRLTRFVVGLRA